MKSCKYTNQEFSSHHEQIRFPTQIEMEMQILNRWPPHPILLEATSDEWMYQLLPDHRLRPDSKYTQEDPTSNSHRHKYQSINHQR